MQEQMHELLKEIEHMRGRLKKIAEGKDLTDPNVVAASQMLDAALNEYCKLVKGKV